MQPFVTHRGRLAVLDWSNVNTDLIIPARYLKRVERTGYGPLLFADKRYATGGEPQVDAPESHGPETPDFPLNSPAARGATILVVGGNFGCGSSREHAVWAVQQAGFRALIAPGKGEGFADIFEGNAYNNGLLPVELPREDWERVAELGRAGGEATVDLQSQTVTLHGAPTDKNVLAFEIPATQRSRLLNGLDAIGETLTLEASIAAHEQSIPAWAVPATDR
jgi:3-isopropylmalate/(R)-2-methylmalate dehydratase small subunit